MAVSAEQQNPNDNVMDKLPKETVRPGGLELEEMRIETIALNDIKTTVTHKKNDSKHSPEILPLNDQKHKKLDSINAEILPLNDSKHKKFESFSPTHGESALFSRGESPTFTTSLSRTQKLTRQKSEREVLVGTPVKEGHVNYLLMYDMLTGIRISVSRCNAKPGRDIVESDYTAAHKLAFDV